MHWKRYAGAASGAELGYIVGNLPGAITGARWGYKAGKWSEKPSSTMMTPTRTPKHKKAKKSKSKGRLGRHMDKHMSRTQRKTKKYERKLQKLGARNAVAVPSVIKDLDDTHSGVGQGSCKIMLNKPTHNIVRSSHNIYVENYAILLKNTDLGTQSIASIAGLGTVDQWDFSTSAPLWYQSGTSYFDLNPSKAITGGGGVYNAAAVAAATTAGFANDRYHLTTAQMFMDFANYQATAVHIDVYFCRAKRDTQDDPTASWRNGLVLDRLGLADQTIVAGTAPGVRGSQVPEMPYAIPQDVKLFNIMWKIMDKQTIVLAGGATHKHTVHVNANILGKKEQLNNQAGIGIKYPKGCFAAMVVVRAQVVADQLSTSPNVYAVTFGASDIGLVVTRRLTFHSLKATVNRFSTEVALQNIRSKDTVGNQFFADVQDNFNAEAVNV